MKSRVLTILLTALSGCTLLGVSGCASLLQSLEEGEQFLEGDFDVLGDDDTNDVNVVDTESPDDEGSDGLSDGAEVAQGTEEDEDDGLSSGAQIAAGAFEQVVEPEEGASLGKDCDANRGLLGLVNFEVPMGAKTANVTVTGSDPDSRVNAQAETTFGDDVFMILGKECAEDQRNNTTTFSVGVDGLTLLFLAFSDTQVISDKYTIGIKFEFLD